METFEAFQVRDALLYREAVIADNAVTEYIDLGELTERGARLEQYELRLFAEASETASFPADTGSILFVEFSNDVGFSDPDIYSCNRWTQTGSAAGTDAIKARYRVPTRCPRYVRVRTGIVDPEGETGATTAKFGFELLG